MVRAIQSNNADGAITMTMIQSIISAFEICFTSRNLAMTCHEVFISTLQVKTMIYYLVLSI